MTTSEIFAAAAQAKVNIHAMKFNYSSDFHCSFEASADGMKIEGRAESEESLDDSVQKAWEKFTRLANYGNKNLIAPMLEHQPSAKAPDDDHI
jgi:hypothetical protein